MNSENRARLEEYRGCIEAFLNEKYSFLSDEPQQKLFEAMKYSLLAGGKRLRPILTFEFCRVSGGDWHNAMPFAAALEMIHTYSLIHDDLPCMDNDDFRRGKPTNHKIYGEAMAVLAGDALLTDAFALASCADLPAKTLSRAIGTLAECAGSFGMVGGQVLDMLSEERECTEQEILNIQTRKTGSLINAACALGVMAARGSEKKLQSACGFAAHIGLAFQIRDDMLDVIGNADMLGKPVGTDAGKNTFVRLYGLETCQELVQKHTNLAISYLSAFEETQLLQELALDMQKRVK